MKGSEGINQGKYDATSFGSYNKTRQHDYYQKNASIG